MSSWLALRQLLTCYLWLYTSSLTFFGKSLHTSIVYLDYPPGKLAQKPVKSKDLEVKKCSFGYLFCFLCAPYWELVSADAPSNLCYREGAHKWQKICTSLPQSILWNPKITKGKLRFGLCEIWMSCTLSDLRIRPWTDCWIRHKNWWASAYGISDRVTVLPVTSKSLCFVAHSGRD